MMNEQKSKIRAAMNGSMHRVLTTACDADENRNKNSKMGSSSFFLFGAEAVFDVDVTEYSFSRNVKYYVALCSSRILHNL
jgi:hypothetical protein